MLNSYSDGKAGPFAVRLSFSSCHGCPFRPGRENNLCCEKDYFHHSIDYFFIFFIIPLIFLVLILYINFIYILIHLLINYFYTIFD